jgi:hypothetical protein
MRKIPTLYQRDPTDMKYLLRDVHPACTWVINGEGIATRKYDGTCVMLDDAGNWWARREVKPGKSTPSDFVAEQTDEVTGKTVGWEPIGASPFRAMFEMALGSSVSKFSPGTYELCGPRINKNPEGFDQHILVLHADAETFSDVPRDYDGLADWLGAHRYEGVVWHHDDGRMAKIKRKDFPRGGSKNVQD